MVDPTVPALTAAARASRASSRLLLAAGSLLVGLMLAEGAVRVVESVKGTSYALQLDAQFDKPSLFQPHPYVGYILSPGAASPPGSILNFSVNAMGFRGENISLSKPARTFRIACLGGSTTYGSADKGDATTWPAQLEQELNNSLPAGSPYKSVEVINAGVVGYTSMESFVNFKMRVMPLEPDLVILYHGINDARVIDRPDFQPDYSHVRMPWVRPVASRSDVLFGWSHLYGWIRGQASIPTVDDATMKPFLGERLAESEERTGLTTWRRTLTELTSLARGNGVHVMLTSFAYTRELKHRKKWMLSAFRVVDKMNAITEELARNLDTLFTDVSEAVGTRQGFFVDSVHLSAAGNRRIARAVGQEIGEAGLLAKQGSAPSIEQEGAKAQR